MSGPVGSGKPGCIGGVMSGGAGCGWPGGSGGVTSGLGGSCWLGRVSLRQLFRVHVRALSVKRSILLP